MFGAKSEKDLVNQAYEAEFEGNQKKAVRLWQQVLKQQPDNIDAIVSLAELLVELNDIKAAVNIIEPAANKCPENSKVQKQFLDILISAKEFEWAKRHADIVDAKNTDCNFRKYVDAAELSDSDAVAVEAEVVSDDDWLSSFAGEALFSKDHAARMNTLFVGRQDVFARMWVSESGNTGYSPVYKPYTPQIVYNHLLGNYTTGIYLTKTDGATRIIAFDIDITTEAINSARGSSEKAAKLRNIAFDYGARLKNFLTSENLNPVLEDSGYKGAHIWLVFDKWSKCGILRRLGEALLVQNGNVPPELAVEIFPKQKHRPKKLGNLIKLPLGIHRKTGRRSVFLDDAAKPYDNQPEALMNIRPSDSTLIPSLLDKYNLPDGFTTTSAKPRPNSHARMTNPAHKENPQTHLITENEFNNDPILNYLLEKCDVLGKLVKRVRSSHLVSYDEKLVLEHTIGHFPNGAGLVNFLLRPCENVDSNFLMGRPHRGCPTSCSKIAGRIPHIAATCDCDCDFGIACANYPTPLNHLYSYVPSTVKALPMPKTADSQHTATARQSNNREQQTVNIVQLLSKLYGK